MAVQVGEGLRHLVAKFETPCASCQDVIQAGQSMFPASDSVLGDARYHHLACGIKTLGSYEALLENAPVCKHWERMGVCFYKERCVFRHPDACLETLRQAAAAQAALKAALRTTNDVRCKENRGPGRRNRVRNRFRAGTLRRWLLDAVGEERLSRGSGVLDVAAGKGELAFELLNLNGVPAVALEPRLLQLQKFTKWLQRGYYSWNSAFKPYNTFVNDAGERQAGKPLLPRQLRMVVTPALSACLLTGLRGGDAAQVPETASDLSATTDRPASGALPASRAAREHAASRPAPPEWESLFQASCVAARDLKWTQKGLTSEHEGAAQAVVQPGLRAGYESGEEQGMNCSLSDGFTTPAPFCESSIDRPQASGHAPGGAISHVPTFGSNLPGAMSTPVDDAVLPRFLLGEDEQEAECQQATTAATPEIDDACEAWAALRDCSAVVAMHPDQATEFAVDLALTLGVPFAVVPCCVYASDFPRRRLPCGSRVTSYDDFIAYLQAKAPDIKTACLPFEGKNTVVYRR